MKALYRHALRLLPRHVREMHGAEMAAVFEQMLRDAHVRHGRLAVYRVALREAIALCRFAWCAHRGHPSPRRIDERRLTWQDSERILPMRDTIWQDVRYAARLLWRSPGFACVGVITMAVAIGANTAIFSLVHGVLLRSLPFPDAGQLVVVGHHSGGDGAINSTTPGNLYDWQASASGFGAIAGFAYTQRIVSHASFTEQTLGAMSVGSVFDVLGRPAAQGRTFTAVEDAPGAPAVVVLSDGLHRRIFGEHSGIGQTVQIGGAMFAVIGVMPPDFAFPDYDAEYWIPARFDTAFRQNRDQYFLLAIARLKSDVTLAAARAQLDTVMDNIRREFPQFTQNATAAVLPAKDFIVQGIETRLWLLFGAVVLVLLIACANLGNLLLARGAARRREMAVRHAVGARPQRLVRQLLTESVLLATVGGLVGVGVGYLGLQALVALMSDVLPRANGIALDGTVLIVTAAGTIGAGIAFGLWPAWQLSHENTAEAVRHGARDTGANDRIRSALVVAEVALAVIVLAGAGLLTRSLSNLRDVRPGFEPSNLVTFNLALPTALYRTPADRFAYFTRALETLRDIPGVTSAAMSTTLPVAGRGTGAWFNILNRPLPPDQTPPAVPYRVVTPEYFQTIGIPLKEGRLLQESDGSDGVRAVVISEAVANRFWPDGSAVGQKIYLGAPENRLFQDAEVVGIVGDVKQAGLDEVVSEAVYIPYRLLRGSSTFWVALRTAVTPESIISTARTQLREIDAAIPMSRVRHMSEVVDASLAPTRSSVYLLGVFALLALTLAVVGVFAVLSYTIDQRRGEMAIRMALGATAQSVMRHMVSQGMRQVVVGLGIGLVACVPLGRFIEALLFNVQPADTITLAGVSLALLLVAMLAVYVPCRRAMRLDPSEVLRQA